MVQTVNTIWLGAITQLSIVAVLLGYSAVYLNNKCGTDSGSNSKQNLVRCHHPAIYSTRLLVAVLLGYSAVYLNNKCGTASGSNMWQFNKCGTT